MKHYVKVNQNGNIILGSNISTSVALPTNLWREIILVNCCNNVLYPGTKIYNYVKADIKGGVIPGSNVASSVKPKGGKWYGFVYQNCCSRLPISDISNDNITTYYNVQEGVLSLHYVLNSEVTAVSIDLLDEGKEVLETKQGTILQGDNVVTFTQSPESVSTIKITLTINEEPVIYNIPK